MLRLKPHERAGCDDIVQRLEIICHNCERDELYCIQRIKELQHTPTDRSEFVMYMEPAKAHPDPINIVDAASILGTPAMPAQQPALDPPAPELVLEQPTEITPLLDAVGSTHSEAPAPRSDTTPDRTVFGHVWRRITGAFSCFGYGLGD